MTQGSTIATMTAVVPSLRVLALTQMKPHFDAVMNSIKCFPGLEELYIEVPLWARVCICILLPLTIIFIYTYFVLKLYMHIIRLTMHLTTFLSSFCFFS